MVGECEWVGGGLRGQRLGVRALCVLRRVLPPTPPTPSRQPTCEPVSMELRRAPVWVFQNLMVRSAVPPPLASRFD